MIRGIVSTSLKFRYLILVVAVALMLFGSVQVRSMPVDVLPEFSPTYVEIQTEALGLSAKEVEQLITVPIEQDLLSGVAWIDTIHSKSVPGLSSIVLLFEPGTDLYRARQMVSERMTQAHALPHVSKPPTMLQPLSATSRFLIVGLSSQQVSPIQMSVLARWTVLPRLMSVPGIANVSIWGQKDRQLQVQVDPERLRAKNLTLHQVLETTGNALWVSSLSFLEASSPGTGGFIDTPQQRLGIMHISPIASAADLAKVAVEGTALKLGDVTSVVEDHQPLIGDAITGAEPGLVLVLEKLPNANTLEVTRNVDAALEQMKPGLPGINVNTQLFRPAAYIQNGFSNLNLAVLIGGLLAIAAMLFLSNWRSAVVAVVSIVLSLQAALFVLNLRGATLNIMLLTGLAIALGSLLDDALGDANHILRALHRDSTKDKELRENLVTEASAQIRRSLLPATLILVLLTVPIFAVQGVTGSFLQPLAVSYALAIAAALVVALVVTPGLSIILASVGPAQAPDKFEPPLARALQRSYSNKLAQAIKAPTLPAAVFIVLAIVSLIAVPLFAQQRGMLPAFRESDVLISLDGAPGTSHPAMMTMLNQARQDLRAIPGVRDVGVHMGRAVFGDEVVGINSAKLWVSLDSSGDYEATLAQIEKVAGSFPDVQHSVQTYLRNRSSPIAEEAAPKVTSVRVFGENFDKLKAQAEMVRQTVAGVNGVTNAFVQLPVVEPSVEIRVDLAKAERYGISPGDVRRSAAILLSGLQVGSLFEDQKIFDVVVWSTPATRQSVSAIRELLIDTASGGHVRLQDVADVQVVSSPSVIERNSISPFLDVVYTTQQRDPIAVASDIKTAIQGIAFPLEYHARVIGGLAEQQEAQQRVLFAVLVAALAGLLVLQTVCERWPLTLALFVTLPLTLAGGVLVAYLAGGISTLALVSGLILVLGIGVRGSIRIIGHLHHLQHEDSGNVTPDLVVKGAGDQVAPVITSALATALIFLPLIFLGNRPGLEIVHEIALVVVGGIVSALAYTLLLVPALYLRLGHVPETVPWMSAEITPQLSK